MHWGVRRKKTPLRFWAHALADDLRRDHRPQIRLELFAGADGGGIIHDLIGASHGYCSRLATAAERQTRAKGQLDKTANGDHESSACPVHPQADETGQRAPTLMTATSQPAAESGSSAGPIAPRNLASSQVWRTLNAEFDALRELENKLLAGRRDDLRLCASCMYPRNASEFGNVSIEKGFSREIIDRYIDIATRAGIELKCPPNVKPVEFWIHCVYQDLLQLKSQELFAPSAAGGTIVRLIESSASYCLRLAVADDEATHRGGPWPANDVRGADLSCAIPGWGAGATRGPPGDLL